MCDVGLGLGLRSGLGLGLGLKLGLAIGLRLLALCDACMAAVIGPRLVCASPWARSAWVGLG